VKRCVEMGSTWELMVQQVVMMATLTVVMDVVVVVLKKILGNVREAVPHLEMCVSVY
jgi:hypothetical protein